MSFSIILVNYNTKELIKDCLNSIFSNCDKGDFEIIVVDNNSSDGSVKALEIEFGDKIKLINNKTNNGFGLANNQGEKIAQGKYLFFLNSDTIIKENILKPLKDVLGKDNNIGIISPGLVLEDGQAQERVFGDFPGLASVILEKFKKPLKAGNELFAVDWVSGAAMIIRKDIFNKIGGFDEKFFMYFEDVDLCKRVKDLGYKICFYPKISVTHLCGRSLKKSLTRKKYYYRSQDYFYKKHCGLFKAHLMRIIRFPYKLINFLNK
ncbi:glycosyltransferase [Candidatus Falkowbacteria bacterium CG11_big_fil_rev_8_21_14_0_20_39_10]|uniref:Glycosyltransferase n=1 Tax=Candidatus Falkowbacteria bacterium CG11_big_fil_rev_8_21_14_0_20_39_10 TaxID=1974570 RepID=A0A2M6K8H5_9BACT|nr:MAG: glycosyltransferase [Candidatus Falkowbacteria bacterium CG11_big_fil_rev_8_21_14_0_20_39_10]